MRLVYDNVTRTTSNSKGVEIRIPGFGNTTSVEWLDPSRASQGAYFKDIANTLVALGYERNVSLRGAPYDFRKAPSKLCESLVDLKRNGTCSCRNSSDSELSYVTLCDVSLMLFVLFF
jgi:lysophospholipase-3